jgi:hypothetical protein
MHASLIRFPLKVLKFASNDKTHTQARSRDKEARRDSTHKPVEEVNKEKKPRMMMIGHRSLTFYPLPSYSGPWRTQMRVQLTPTNQQRRRTQTYSLLLLLLLAADDDDNDLVAPSVTLGTLL